MGIQHLFGNEPFWDWRQFVTKLLQQHDTDIMRIWRRLGQTPDPVGAPPAGLTPWTPVPGTSGLGGGQTYEGYLAGDLAASTGSGTAPGTATLTLYAVVSGTWQATGATITVTNRDDNFYAQSGNYLIAKLINGEYRPVPCIAPEDLFINGTLATSLASGGSATLNITIWNGSAWATNGKTVTVYDRFGLTATLPIGTLIGATWHAQSARYLGTSRGCS